MTIRWRLTLWFSLILTAILVVSGVLLYSLLDRFLISSIDSNLQAVSAQIHGVINPMTITDPSNYSVIHSRLPPINEFSLPGTYIQFVDADGVVVVKSNNLLLEELPVNPALIEKGLQGNIAVDTVTASNGVHVRIMVSPLYLKDQTLVVEVGQSLKPAETVMGTLAAALLAGAVIALALSVISGAVLVRRTLAPVERITRTASSITESADLSRRVDYTGARDEIGRLATTFDQLIEQLDRAFASQKHFVADASHELRTPLTVIRGNIDLLKRPNLTEKDRQESLRAIESEARRMSGIVSELLLLAELESHRTEAKEPVSLARLVQEESRRAQQLAGKRKISIGRVEEISLPGDADRLKQLLSNLVDNAVQYTGENGTIALSLYRDSEYAYLEVTDTGIGIAAEHIPHIFERFYRVDKARSRAGGGTGLGLAIVKEIAQRHNGGVTVRSEPGKGSTFTVYFKI
ncbi:MAG: ATP-binding protein [Dehalococcoidia bacterium]|nr:ATP-binding protein [Dehalococcoidia bacterium]